MHRDIETSASPVRQSGGRAGRSVVAVIGIDQYSIWPRLGNAVSDARGAVRLFTRLGFEEVTRPLLDAAASAEAMWHLVTDELAQLASEDSLILFFAGHGHTHTASYGDVSVKTGYLIPVDGAQPRGQTTRTWVRLDSWLSDIARLPPRHILVIIDACHSGLALTADHKWREAAPWQTDELAALTARRSRRVITSALDDQRATDGGPYPGHSLFTGCLIEGLTGGLAKNGRRVTTGRELGQYLHMRVRSYPRSTQTPDVGAFELDDRGDIVIPLEPVPTASQRQAQRTTTSVSTPIESYFDRVRPKLNLETLRRCQKEAYSALAAYFGGGGQRAACVMSVGAGKTALGIATCLAFARQRALIVTPGSVIRGAFDQALDHASPRNVLYALPRGPLTPGVPPPSVLTLSREREEGELRALRDITRDELLTKDIIVTNFHVLGTGHDPNDLLYKLHPDDIDLLVIDEAHIAAAESYQRLLAHFAHAKALLMSACFQRLDGKPIDADVTYRYRLVDSIVDGHAKNLRIKRFAPDSAQTVYEVVWPDGHREEIVGRDAILALLKDENKLARVTARSHEPIRQVMRAVREALDAQAMLLHPVKPRVLFSALGERHAEQIAQIATEHGIPSAHVHHGMTFARIKATRARFEEDSGDLQGLVQLKMLGQGYDFPPITVVVPMRPYGSFSEFYQFIGRGIRVLSHPALEGRVRPDDQSLDIIFHAELGLDDHISTIYRENDMDPFTSERIAPPGEGDDSAPAGTHGHEVALRPDTFVLFERGILEQRIVHDRERVEQRRAERELEALAHKYSAYAASSESPVSFQQYVALLRDLHE